MPVVALATTELPTVIEHGVNGYVSCDVDELLDAMRALIVDPVLARRVGRNARETARQRFGLERFVHDWNHAFAEVLELGSRSLQPAREVLR
jgi:glycosyltransferase involved in cell wall biosynthesis